MFIVSTIIFLPSCVLISCYVVWFVLVAVLWYNFPIK
nr:MAG TPA: hypothetical protein [Caudoviricetes sp.]